MENILKYLFALLAIAMTACQRGQHEVRVVKYNGTDLLGGHMVTVVTASGDTVMATIDESTLFETKIPFSATMVKDEIEGKGHINAITKKSKFEVTVIGKAPSISIGTKVLVVTKSGMSVECDIAEEIILNNRFPFYAVMEKEQIERFGWIRTTKAS